MHFEGDLIVTVAADPVRVYPKTEVAPGLWLDNTAVPPRIMATNRRFSTAACECVFQLSDRVGRLVNRWRVELVDPAPDGKQDRLLITALN